VARQLRRFRDVRALFAECLSLHLPPAPACGFLSLFYPGCSAVIFVYFTREADISSVVCDDLI
jgi:hypothetical protein